MKKRIPFLVVIFCLSVILTSCGDASSSVKSSITAETMKVPEFKDFWAEFLRNSDNNDYLMAQIDPLVKLWGDTTVIISKDQLLKINNYLNIFRVMKQNISKVNMEVHTTEMINSNYKKKEFILKYGNFDDIYTLTYVGSTDNGEKLHCIIFAKMGNDYKVIGLEVGENGC